MSPLDQQRGSHTLRPPTDRARFVLATVRQQRSVERGEIRCLRERHPVVAPKGPDFVLHAAFLVAFARRAELRLEPPMRPKRVEAGRLFPAKAPDNPLDRRFEVVVAHAVEDPTEVGKGALLRLKKSLLRGAPIGPMERRAPG